MLKNARGKFLRASRTFGTPHSEDPAGLCRPYLRDESRAVHRKFVCALQGREPIGLTDLE